MNLKDRDTNAQIIVSEYTGEVTKFQHEVSLYNTEVQEKTTKMQHYQLLHAQLTLEYKSAFVAPGAEE